jgi:hypothetical protein
MKQAQSLPIVIDCGGHNIAALQHLAIEVRLDKRQDFFASRRIDGPDGLITFKRERTCGITKGSSSCRPIACRVFACHCIAAGSGHPAFCGSRFAFAGNVPAGTSFLRLKSTFSLRRK